MLMFIWLISTIVCISSMIAFVKADFECAWLIPIMIISNIAMWTSSTLMF